ncbi:MAG: hypothetical protein ACOYBD_11205 [Bilifractor sp.]|jgi:hypothetical protein
MNIAQIFFRCAIAVVENVDIIKSTVSKLQPSLMYYSDGLCQQAVNDTITYVLQRWSMSAGGE